MRRFASTCTPWGGAALFLVAAGLGGCMQTSTYGTGERPGRALFSEVLGGLGKAPEEPIEYQPRAPLVMPPTAGQLPPPVEVASNADVDWPGEPTGPGGPRWGDENSVDDVNSAEYRRLKPLAALQPDRDRNERIVINDERGSQYEILDRNQRETFQAAVQEAEGISAERRFLTDPPDTYREPAATAPTEFEDIKKERGFFLTRWLTGG
jgi:hypothetical protein